MLQEVSHEELACALCVQNKTEAECVEDCPGKSMPEMQPCAREQTCWNN